MGRGREANVMLANEPFRKSMRVRGNIPCVTRALNTTMLSKRKLTLLRGSRLPNKTQSSSCLLQGTYREIVERSNLRLMTLHSIDYNLSERTTSRIRGGLGKGKGFCAILDLSRKAGAKTMGVQLEALLTRVRREGSFYGRQ